jgi:uncharacterized protein YndB with AHSA1/START domain
MTEAPVVHNTFVVERDYPATPERVFAACSDPVKKRRWFAEGENHTIDEFEMDFRVGGRERARSHFKEGSPFPGTALLNDGIYHDIVTNRRIVTSATMSLGDRRISVSLVTVEISPSQNGAKLVVTHQGVFFEGSDGPERRQAGWQKIADRLAKELASE